MKTFYKKLSLLLLVAAMSVVQGWIAPVWATTWQRVTAVTELSNGDEVILASTGADGTAYVMINKASDAAYNYYPGKQVTISSGKITTDDAMVLKIKFNTTKEYCAFCTSENSYNSYWLKDDGTKNHLAIYEHSNVFNSVTNITSNDWCWKISSIENSSKAYKWTLLNGKTTSRALECYSTNQFASHEYTSGTPGQLCVFKKACNDANLTLSPSTKSIEYDGESQTFSITASRSGSGTLTWASNNSTCATVSGSGTSATVTVKGVSGTSTTVTITCTLAANGDYCDDKETCTLTITPKAHIITFKANGGTGEDKTQSVKYNVSTALSANTFTRTGYRFLGWSESSSATSATYTDNGSVTFTTDKTLYAVWKEQVTVTFKPNGGTPNTEYTQTVDKGVSTTLDSHSYSKTGHDFIGFNTSSSATTATHKSGTAYTFSANTTLYAIFTPKKFTVTYDKNASGATGTTESHADVAYNTSINLKANGFTYSGYEFQGWTEGSTSGTLRQPGDSYTVTSNKTFYAKWCRDLSSLTPTISSTGVSTTGATINWSLSEAGTGATYDVNITGPNSFSWSQSNNATTSYTLSVTASETEERTYTVTVKAYNYCGNVSAQATETVTIPKKDTFYDLRAFCDAVVTYHFPDDIYTEKVEVGNSPVGYTPAGCADKRFVGWSTTDIGSTLTQDKPAIVDVTTEIINEDKDYYAVFASINGGKVTGTETLTYTEDFESEKTSGYVSSTTWITNGLRWEGKNIQLATSTINGNSYNCVKFLYNAESRKNGSIATTHKINDLSRISFGAAYSNSNANIRIKYSTDGQEWKELKKTDGTDITILKATKAFSENDIKLSDTNIPIGDYFIQFFFEGESATIYLDDIKFYTTERSVWYSDYSNGCGVAASATLTFKDEDGTTDLTPKQTHAATPSVPENYVVPENGVAGAPTKTGYTFEGIKVRDLTYLPGEVYLLAHDVDATCIWSPNPEVELTGEVLVTATNERMIMAVAQLTLTAAHLTPTTGSVTITSDAGSGLYFSTARNVNWAKADKPTESITVAADASGEISQTIYVHYRPTAVGTGEVETVSVSATYNDRTEFTCSKNVSVRNMPDKFVIAAKVGSIWYALPANMTNAQNPAGVLISVDETTWTAQGPATTAYSLWPVKTTNTTGDLYQTKGEMLRFAGNESKALWANDNKSANTIQNNAKIETLGTGADIDNYMWAVTTTATSGTFKYTLTAQTENANSLRYWAANAQWGTYGSGIEELYLIPLTVIEPLEMTVMEWGATEMAVQYAGGGTLNSVSINGTAASSASMSGLTGDIQRIEGLGDLTGSPAQQMIISITEDETVKQKILTIPFILQNSKTNDDLRNMISGSADDKTAVTRNTEVVIRSGATFTVDNTTGNYADVYVYPGGKWDVQQDISVSSVYLRGGFSWLDDAKDFRLPEMKVTDEKKIEGIGNPGNGVYYDLTADASMYYMIAFPKDVDLSKVTNEGGTGEFNAWIKQYSGKGRTETPKYQTTPQWTNASEIKRGIGYEIAVEPRNSRQYGILRFPLLKGAWKDETDPTVNVVAWGMENKDKIGANNVGWNLVGNPFFSGFKKDATQESSIVTDGFTPHIENNRWDGTYDWTSSEVKYYTIPNKMDYGYEDVRATGYVLEAFYPFYVQVKSGTESSPATLTFSSAGRALKAAPMLRAAQTQRELMIDFTIEDENGKTDLAGLNISDEYSADFDMDDKEKTIEPSVPQMKIYSLVGSIRTAFNSLPENAVQTIPLGFIAPTAGEYEIELKDAADLQYLKSAILIDHEEDDHQWNLLTQGGYLFSTTAQTAGNDTRFTLSLQLRADDEVMTGISLDGLDECYAISDAEGLMLHNLPADADVWVYDMTGKLIASRLKDSRFENSVVRMSVPAGVYNIRIVSGTEARTLRTIVR